MNKKIIFSKNSIKIESYKEELKKYTSEKISSQFKDFNNLWDYDVEFDKTVTVENFLNNLKPFIDEIQFYLNPYIKYDLKDFFEILDKPADSIHDEDKVDYVEMYWVAEIWETEDIINDKKNSEFEMWGGYHGVTKEKNGFNISFGLTPLNNWKHYKLKLNENLICYKNTEEEVHKLLFESRNAWTLFDVLKYFFIELTFYGSLSDIEELKRNLENTLDDIQNGQVLSSKESSEILNELEIKSLESELIEMVKQEKYEEAVVLRNKIQELKNKVF